MCKNIVTEIKRQNRNKGRVNVYVDNKFSFSCSSEIIYRLNLKKDAVIDTNYFKSIIDEDNYLKCKNQALKIIEKTYKTEMQMYDKLVGKNYDEKTVKRTMKFLKNYKFINDYRYTKIYINEKIRSCGKEKIKYTLLKKGVARNIIEEQLNNIDISIYEESAFYMASKKYNSIKKDNFNVSDVYKKLGNYLIRNGYNMDMVKKILRKIVRKEDFKIKENIYKKDINRLYSIAKKRYNIITRSENDSDKVKSKLVQYLMRRNYSWEDIKPVLKSILDNDLKD